MNKYYCNKHGSFNGKQNICPKCWNSNKKEGPIEKICLDIADWIVKWGFFVMWWSLLRIGRVFNKVILCRIRI